MPAPVVLGEFAVNPACICSATDLGVGRQIFGFQHGAVVSDFPNGWHKEIKARASQLPEPDRGIFLGRLDQFRELAVARVRPSEPGEGWLAQATSANGRFPFHAILDFADSPVCRSYSEAIADGDLRKGLRENKIPRNPIDLVKSFWPLAVSSDKFSVIDPFLSPSPAHQNFLRALVAARRTASKGILYLDLHIEFDDDPLKMRDASDKCKSAFRTWAKGLGENLAVALRWWSDDGVGELHPRYLLSERGGVRLDRGAVVPPRLDQQDHDTDVGMLTEDFVKEIERRYSETYQPLQLKGKDCFRI